MTDQLPYLAWLKSFEACARHLSFTAAADELGLTQAAVSQHIKALESKLGAALFIRKRRGVELTPQGASYLPHVQAVFVNLIQSTQQLFGSPTNAEVKLITPVSFGTLWLAPRLARFAKFNPGISLAISTMTVPTDYAEAKADLEIRFGSGQWPGLQSLRLTTERLLPVCSAALQRTQKDWTKLPLLTVRGARQMWHEWFLIAGQAPTTQAFHNFDTYVTAQAAAEANAGILLGSKPLVDAALAEKRLTMLSKFELPSENGHFLTFSANKYHSLEIRAVVNWLLTEAKSQMQAPH